MDLQYLSAEEVLNVHNALTEEFAQTGDPIYPPGVRYMGLLESAVFRQHTGLNGRAKYPNPIDNVATLTYGLCCDHPFHNGNKRTALVSMLVHLDKNKFTLVGIPHDELLKMIIAVASHEMIPEHEKVKLSKSNRFDPDDEVRAISNWLRKRVKTITKGEKQITYRQLRKILAGFSFELANPHDNAIEIIRRQEITSKNFFGVETTKIHTRRLTAIGYPGENAFVTLKVLKQVREVCRLREIDGYDTDAFYDGGAVVDALINRYRNILKRLANK